MSASRRTGTSSAAIGETASAAEDRELVDALRRGDERAFTSLERRLHPSMLRVARLFAPTLAVAEEVVQDTWLAAVRALRTFEGRSSLRSWLFGILIRRARSGAVREARHAPLGRASVDWAARFRPWDDPVAPGHWAVGAAPSAWSESPEQLVLREELRERVLAAIATLPPRQRAAITLRDIEGLSAEEVCNVLAVSETNQRVLLHRARLRVRAVLEAYLDDGVTKGVR